MLNNNHAASREKAPRNTCCRAAVTRRIAGPPAWEAMLNLNKMRSARRKLAQSDAPPPATKDRD